MPIVGIAGKHGTTMTARLIAWLLQISGKKTGLSCADGLFVNGRLLPRDGLTDWETGERLLLNKSVEAGVFESSARMILSEGLAYDKCAVGVVTDVSDFEDVSDFYIDSADKLYNVLRTQVDVVLPSGAAVLNAADPNRWPNCATAK
jgi:cyanophycin synthetase